MPPRACLSLSPVATSPLRLICQRLVSDALATDAVSDARSLRDFQAIVGSLLYCATHTRPDIAYAVGLLCRAMSRPTPQLHAAALRILYYLHMHRTVGLRYEPSAACLRGFTDSDWAVKHSTSGFVFEYCSAAISWSSRKQPTIALSSCEAEIMAASEGAKEAIYLRNFLSELGEAVSQPTPMAVDNKGAQDLSYNPEHHARTEHIERRHYFPTALNSAYT